jgi:presenilin-like A22 family membrane protease
MATPEAKACSSGVHPVKSKEEAKAPAIVIFLRFFFIIRFPSFILIIVYNKREGIVFQKKSYTSLHVRFNLFCLILCAIICLQSHYLLEKI